jgi:hypothetical protein
MNLEKIFNQPQVKPILQFSIDSENKEQVTRMYIDVLKKEIELGHALTREIGCKWVIGEKLDVDEIKGRKYQLSQREKELEQLSPLPF